MRVLVASDAWHPQINGVVRMLAQIERAANNLGAEFSYLTPSEFLNVPLPGYPEIRLALPSRRAIAERITSERPDAIHVATEGPIGHVVRRYCVAEKIPFTTFFHTRFPDYVAARTSFPKNWTWAYLRQFHKPSKAVMATAPSLVDELQSRGFPNVVKARGGVDSNDFNPRFRSQLGFKAPIFLFVGRLSIEKNIDEFLNLDLPGTKLIVGDGPLRESLSHRFKNAIFLGYRTGKELATIYASSDVFVFPSKTDTYGLVLLEALASGLPIAAFPVPGPLDVIGDAPVGILSSNLRLACLQALCVSKNACRNLAIEMSWEKSAHRFLANAI